MRYDSWPNLATMFFENAATFGDKPFLWGKKDGVYESISWRETADQVRALARGLRRLGLKSGDRILLASQSCPQWLIADMAIMAAGGVSVPTYTTNTRGDYLHILENCSACGAIVSDGSLAAPLIAAAIRSNTLDYLIHMEPLKQAQDVGFKTISWADALDQNGGQGDEAPPENPEEKNPENWAKNLSRRDLACLIYTSGTGGAPKGVMLSHGAILSNCGGAYGILKKLGLKDEVFLSFLPLSHSYEHMAGHFFPLSIGAQIYYAEGADKLSANMIEARPTIMTAVPRLYESLYQKITRGIERQGGMKARLFEKTVALGARAYEGGHLSLCEHLLNLALDFLVRRKVRAKFGGRLKALVSGGAPLNYDIGLFFTALGLRILQGYGQTESAPVISCNPPDKNRIDTVGPPMEGVEVRLADDGEIIVRGELVMDGYWNDPEATGEVLYQGWLHTGDVGALDEDGYLRITDRKKDIIVNSGGDNISPQRIEGILTLENEISQAMVYGDRRPYLVAVIVAEEDSVTAWAKSRGLEPDLKVLKDNREFVKFMAQSVERVNANLSLIERVRHFLIATEPFSTQNELMTPTLKIRRHKITDIYGKALEGLYG